MINKIITTQKYYKLWIIILRNSKYYFFYVFVDDKLVSPSSQIRYFILKVTE